MPKKDIFTNKNYLIENFMITPRILNTMVYYYIFI